MLVLFLLVAIRRYVKVLQAVWIMMMLHLETPKRRMQQNFPSVSTACQFNILHVESQIFLNYSPLFKLA